MEINELPLVSVVTPVYNGENYIDECIQSVRNQIYQNWEYIILNNCSTDGTLEIAKRHAAEDARIRIVSTDELLPLIKNHNHALRQISQNSKYCKIVHADDSIFASCLELMVSTAEKHPTAGIVGAYSLWGRKVVSDGLSHYATFLSGKDLCRLTLLNKVYCFWSPSSLLIRSDLIRRNNCFYNEKHLHADDEACYEILRETDFAFVHQVLTFIRKHDESATSTMTASYNKIILSNFDLFTRYGPIYLGPHEYKKQLTVRLNQYYGFLADSLFNLREKEFWKYHKLTIQEIGYPFSMLKLIKASLLQLIGRPIVTLATFTRAINTSSNLRHS
jgi:glycosyltransferase involved in cell wall biosynthesis